MATTETRNKEGITVAKNLCTVMPGKVAITGEDTRGSGNFSTAQLIVGQRCLPSARAREMYRRWFAIEQPLRLIILEPMFANANRLVTNAIHDLPSSEPYLSEPLLLSARLAIVCVVISEVKKRPLSPVRNGLFMMSYPM
jgi:hypothetical protein